MSPIKWLGVAVLALGCAWTTFHFMGKHESKKSAAAEAQSIVQQVAATASAAQGAASDQINQVQASTVTQDDARVAADVAKRKAKPRPVPPAPTPGTPDPAPVVAPDPVDDGTAQLIADQVKEITDLKDEVHTLTLSRDSWKLAYEDETKAAALKEIALQAQIKANKSSLWKGRIEGFAIGIATGYAAGKL